MKNYTQFELEGELYCMFNNKHRQFWLKKDYLESLNLTENSINDSDPIKSKYAYCIYGLEDKGKIESENEGVRMFCFSYSKDGFDDLAYQDKCPSIRFEHYRQNNYPAYMLKDEAVEVKLFITHDIEKIQPILFPDMSIEEATDNAKENLRVAMENIRLKKLET